MSKLLMFFGLSLVAIIVVIVGGNYIGVWRDPAEKVVLKMYEAISEGDTNAYMDTILPTNRRQPNLLGLVNAISIGIGPVGVDLSKLTAVTISDLDVSIIRSNETYALVQATGKIRYPILMLEVEFCDQHDVRLYSDGKWYVDVYAPERAERLEKILNIRQQELLEMANNSSSQAELNLLRGGFATGLETALDLCE